MLTVEMLSHAIAKNMDSAILIAGDDDFTPLVAELLRHGTYVEVWSDKRSQSAHLAHSADDAHFMDLTFYLRLTPPQFQRENPIPDVMRSQKPSEGIVIQRGISHRGPVEIVAVGANDFFSVRPRAAQCMPFAAQIEFPYSTESFLIV